MPRGREFFKLSGSGNDFIFFDARSEPAGELDDARVIAALCARGTGIGADGVVFLERSDRADFRIRYLNADGTLAALCGNASLCGARLAVELGAARPGGFTFETGAGPVAGRVRDGIVEVDLDPATGERPHVSEVALGGGERRAGFAVTGVPHLVILCDEIERADVAGRGPSLRRHPAFPDGANVNWTAPAPGGRWRYRTYERGVEGETLACGTGAVTTALMLRRWGLAGETVHLVTSSGLQQTVRLRESRGVLHPSLGGEARIVFRGELGEIP